MGASVALGLSGWLVGALAFLLWRWERSQRQREEDKRVVLEGQNKTLGDRLERLEDEKRQLRANDHEIIRAARKDRDRARRLLRTVVDNCTCGGSAAAAGEYLDGVLSNPSAPDGNP